VLAPEIVPVGVISSPLLCLVPFLLLSYCIIQLQLHFCNLNKVLRQIITLLSYFYLSLLFTSKIKLEANVRFQMKQYGKHAPELRAVPENICPAVAAAGSR
jgi:hypothetical protein